MNILIVLAHPSPGSLNAAMKDIAVDTLTAAGHTVAVSDLYAENFKAVADADDFRHPVDPEDYDYAREQAKAYEDGTIAADILREQERLMAADLVIFQFPLWWYSAPAILKGWLERVLSMGYAYGKGRMFDRGGANGTLAMLSFTTNGVEPSYAVDGWHGPIDDVTTPLHQGLRFVGFRILPPFVAYNVVRGSEEDRAAILSDYRHRLRELPTLTPLSFPPMDAYGPTGQLR